MTSPEALPERLRSFIELAALTVAEQERHEEFEADLCGVQAPPDPLRFAEDQLVTMVCAPLPADTRSTRPPSRNRLQRQPFTA